MMSNSDSLVVFLFRALLSCGVLSYCPVFAAMLVSQLDSRPSDRLLVTAFIHV